MTMRHQDLRKADNQHLGVEQKRELAREDQLLASVRDRISMRELAREDQLLASVRDRIRERTAREEQLLASVREKISKRGTFSRSRSALI